MIEGPDRIHRLTELVKKPAEKSSDRCNSQSAATACSTGGGGDLVTLGSRDNNPVTYEKPAQAVFHGSRVFATLSKLVSQILQDQNIAERIQSGDYETNLMEKITPEHAKALVGSDDWQPEKTAAKIFSFSRKMSGNNQEKAADVKESIAEGFELAKQFLGEEMPDTTKKTYSAVMQLVEDWKPDH